MKVGTDGTLLGAWAPIPQDGSLRILDVGTGSGLIAMMLAQRIPEAQILAIDIDAEAAQQAADNFLACPWPERLKAQHIRLQELSRAADPALFDLIVSNPPYFVDSLKNPDPSRSQARHTDTLSFEELIECCARLLRQGGTLALVLPAETEQTIRHLAAENELTPISITHVRTRAQKPPRRLLIAFSKADTPQPIRETDLCLMGEDGAPRSQAYHELTKEFYL